MKVLEASKKKSNLNQKKKFSFFFRYLFRINCDFINFISSYLNKTSTKPTKPKVL